MDDLIYLINFVSTAVWRVFPFFAISIFLSVLVNALDLGETIRRAFAARVGVAILLATAVGAFSPFCSCTVVPIVAAMLASGVPLAPVMSFWIASPTMDPEIFVLSVGILGWPMALARLGSTLLLSLAAGYLTWSLTQTGLLRDIGAGLRAGITAAPGARAATTNAASCCSTAPAQAQPLLALTTIPVAASAGCAAQSCALPQPEPRLPVPVGARPPAWRLQLVNSLRAIKWPQFGREMARQSWQLGRWLLLAFFLEALIVAYVPQAAIAGTLGGDGWWAVPLASLIGVPLYLNNLGALPIIDGLLAQGMQPGAAIAFLIAGPVTTIPALTAVYGIVKKRIFALYLAISLTGAMLLGWLVNLVL
jgi:uncharacterized protein